MLVTHSQEPCASFLYKELASNLKNVTKRELLMLSFG